MHGGKENAAQRVPTAPPCRGAGTEILKNEGLVPQIRRQLCSSLRSLFTEKKIIQKWNCQKIKAWLCRSLLLHGCTGTGIRSLFPRRNNRTSFCLGTQHKAALGASVLPRHGDTGGLLVFQAHRSAGRGHGRAPATNSRPWRRGTLWYCPFGIIFLMLKPLL